MLFKLLKGTGMRGSDRRSEALFSYVNLEERIRSDHPLRQPVFQQPARSA